MSHRLAGAVILLALMITSEVWALGLGDIRLDSALNAPLRAEIELVSATPEELQTLRVQLASTETFERYGIDRPLFLSNIQFDIKTGVNGSVIKVTSTEAIREPFVTFLVEATSPQGRVLREYTILLDPPTFAPPAAVEAAPQVAAPQRVTEADRGVIARSDNRTSASPSDRRVAEPAFEPGSAQAFDNRAGDEYRVARSETLWGIAKQTKPDSRLTINQTMLAIYEANPQAFDGNINRLRAGARLRIPSADEIYRIGRQDALAEVRRQMSEWGGAGATAGSRPSLSLVPPDETDTTPGEDAYRDYKSGGIAEAPDSELQDRVRELEQQLSETDALLAIRDNELAALRAELASRQQGQQEQAPAVEDSGFEDAAAGVDMDVEAVDETADVIADQGETAAEPAAEEKPAPVVAKREEPGLLSVILDAITGFWGMLIGGLLLLAAVLVWFARRAAMKSDDDSGWEELDADDDDDGDAEQELHDDTTRLHAIKPSDDTFVVHEQKATDTWADTESDTLEVEAAEEPRSLEDTFSSETAINLDQADPIAEADFHMAYGLYDQAADLITSALAVQPDRKDFMAKLCEIYFVWGNKDAFVNAAQRLHAALGGQASKDWDKTVIMGQQIAADNKLFSGSGAAGGLAAEGIDLSFEDDDGSEAALDLDFAAEDGSGDTEILDIGGQDFDSADGVDFVFDGMDDDEDSDEGVTAETQGFADSDDLDVTTESPTIEQPPIGEEATSEMPILESPEGKSAGSASDMTAEINLDDLGLDLGGLDELGSGLDEDTGQTGLNESLSDTDFNLDDMDLGGSEGSEDTKADFVDLDFSEEDFVANEGSVGEDTITDGTAETGINEALEVEDIGEAESDEDDEFDINDALAATAETPKPDFGSAHSGSDEDDDDSDMDIDFDASLLDATGQTQVLSEDMSAKKDEASISDDDATLLAGGLDTARFAELADDDDLDVTVQTPVADDESTVLGGDLDDFDFAETEALPKGVLDEDESIDFGDAAAGADVDLDLGDLTAALQVSGMENESGAEDGTVEHSFVDDDDEVDLSDQTLDFDIGNVFSDNDAPTVALSPEDRGPALDEARTMTEVGTKLDLARAYVDMGDPAGARSILEEVLEEGDESQQQQARKLLEALPR